MSGLGVYAAKEAGSKSSHWKYPPGSTRHQHTVSSSPPPEHIQHTQHHHRVLEQHSRISILNHYANGSDVYNIKASQ